MDSFERFSPEHIGTLLVIAIAITIGLLLIRKGSDKSVQTLSRILSVLVLLGEIIQDILLIRDGGNLIEFLPLHLCNLGIFVNLAAAFSKGKIQSFFAEISVVLIMPGTAGALIFPDWTYRPFWSYLPLLCFFTHSLLLFIPLMFLVMKKAQVSFRHFWYSYLFLLVVTPPIYLLDKRTGVNYMFLLYPIESTPLEWINNLFGGNYYILGLGLLVTVILAIEYSIYSSFRAMRISSK